MVGLVKSRMEGVLGPVCGKVRLRRPSEGFLRVEPLMRMAPANLAELGEMSWLRALRAVEERFGGEVCVILSAAAWVLMSVCHGSLMIHRITDEKARSQRAIFALCPSSYS